jgi:hypothetical protein
MGDGERDSESDNSPSAFPRATDDASKRRPQHLRPASATASPVPRYGSMGKTPPMVRRRAPSPPELVLPDASNPETDDTAVETRKSHSSGTADDADGEGSVRSGTPLASNIKHPHWEPTTKASTEGNDKGDTSGSGRDSSSGDEDNYLPPARKISNVGTGKSPRIGPRTPSILGKSPRIFAGKGDKPGLTRIDSKRNTSCTYPSACFLRISTADALVATAAAPRYPETIEALYALCQPDERRFFTLLDAELEKVESFYHERESDAIRRSHQLKAQLAELEAHRRVFHEAEAERERNGVGAGVKRYLREPMQAVAHEVGKHVPFVAAVAGEPPREPHSSPAPSEDGLRRRKNGTTMAAGAGMADEEDPALRDFDPEKYQRYKKKLKVALMEYYKELEILKNFRVRRGSVVVVVDG